MRFFEMAICDDEDFYIEDICGYLKAYMSEEEVELNVSKYHSGIELLDAIQNNQKKYDLIFLDVDMPMLTGMETASKIRETDKDVILCFITSHRQYSFDAFQVNASGYLEKPVSYITLRNMLNKCIQEIRYLKDKKMAEDTYLQISCGKEPIILFVKKVIYIEKQRNKCILHTTDGEITCYETLANLYEKLNHETFFYIHQGYIVNFNHILEVGAKNVFVTGPIEVPISRKYYKAIRERHMDKIYRLRADMERERIDNM